MIWENRGVFIPLEGLRPTDFSTVWITCGIYWCFYQLFGPLVSNWCNAKFLQIFSDEETNSTTYLIAWGYIIIHLDFWANNSFKFGPVSHIKLLYDWEILIYNAQVMNNIIIHDNIMVLFIKQFGLGHQKTQISLFIPRIEYTAKQYGRSDARYYVCVALQSWFVGKDADSDIISISLHHWKRKSTGRILIRVGWKCIIGTTVASDYSSVHTQATVGDIKETTDHTVRHTQDRLRVAVFECGSERRTHFQWVCWRVRRRWGTWRRRRWSRTAADLRWAELCGDQRKTSDVLVKSST